MNEVYLGCSGYDYDEWKGIFYPEKTSKSKFLEYYSTQFNALELNGSYYRMPTASQLEKMALRSGRKMKFCIKAFKGLTHEIVPEETEKTVTEFKSALEPLQKKNLLLSVLLQFPQSFHYDDKERFYLDSLLKLMAGLPLTLEIRNIKWQNDKVYAELRKRGIAWCVTDNPDLKDLPKLEPILTSNAGDIRFHGRNKEMWYKGNNVTRYDYLYNDAELLEIIPIIKELMGKASLVQIYFNNHAKAQATINAKKLKMLLLNS